MTGILINKELKERLEEIARSTARIMVLTGAGISVESGIPTFRGSEGFWTIGSREYHPQEMATLAMFLEQPYEVWKWYLYRMGVCAEAEPNSGHHAVAALEKSFPNRFKLITQNVDNLHLRAGSSLENTYQIHGNIFYARCLANCGQGVVPLPGGLKAKYRSEELSEVEKKLLLCPDCGKLYRPHVLWFDETYNEDYYRFHSSLEAASKTNLLITVGTSGATNLPNRVAYLVFENGGMILDINPERNPFAELADKSAGGAFLRGISANLLPEIAEIMIE